MGEQAFPRARAAQVGARATTQFALLLSISRTICSGFFNAPLVLRGRLDRKGLESEPLLERYRDLNLAQLQLQRFEDIYWRGMRRSKKDYTEREREHRPDHLLLVFDRFLIFLERGSQGSATDGGAPLPGGHMPPGHSLPTLHLRPLPMLDITSVVRKSSSSAPVETKKQIIQLCPIVELAAVVKFMADARGLLASLL